MKTFSLFLSLLLSCTFTFAVAQKTEERNICQFLGNRPDKNFLGSGNVALLIEPQKTKVLFVQQWKEKGLFDWASGTIKNWFPDQIEMKETVPPIGAKVSVPPISRKIFITRDDVLGMELVWKNPGSKEILIDASFDGNLPGTIQKDENSGSIFSTSAYSGKVHTPISFVLSSNLKPNQIDLQENTYTAHFKISLKPNEEKSLILFLGTSTNLETAKNSLNYWKKINNILNSVRKDWNSWFANEIPQFQSSNPYFEKLYYYRWWSLYTKMIFAKIGHFYYPSPREGTVMYDGVVSYSGSCISVDELRWLRNSDWAFSTTKEFFAPENMNDGYLSNHIWDWGIDDDLSNMDQLGRSVPYQNYAVDAFYGALLVHPDEGKKTLPQVWPQMLSNLDSYRYLFDIDKDGLYETYPWSNSAGQEWTARFSYFNPIPEMFRNERGRDYKPDGSNAKSDMELMEKIKNSLVSDPDIIWPKNSEELYRIYYGTEDHRLATVDQSTYVFKNFQSASELAKLMKDNENQELYKKMSEETRSKILSTMWNPEDHYFYDVKPIEQKQAKVKATTGFYVF